MTNNEADVLPAARVQSALGGLPPDYGRNPWLDCNESLGTNAMGADEEEVTDNPTFQVPRQLLQKTVMFPGKAGAPDGRSNLGQRSSIVDWRIAWPILNVMLRW